MYLHIFHNTENVFQNKDVHSRVPQIVLRVSLADITVIYVALSL